jgi:hypothetical protein
VDADGLCMGQEFVKAGNVPPWVGEMVLTAAAKVFSSSTQVDIYAKLPYFMNPVLAACQIVNVARPGSEPSLTEAGEDMRLFAPELADKTGAQQQQQQQPRQRQRQQDRWHAALRHSSVYIHAPEAVAAQQQQHQQQLLRQLVCITALLAAARSWDCSTD